MAMLKTNTQTEMGIWEKIEKKFKIAGFVEIRVKCGNTQALNGTELLKQNNLTASHTHK